jgi:hypothetical protein
MYVKENLATISIEGFKCYKSVFCLICESLDEIQRKSGNLKSGTIFYQGGTPVIPGISRYSASNSSETKKDNDDFPYKCKVEPKNLHGVDFLWDLILLNSDEKVVEKALEFLNKLFTSFGDELEGKESELRTDYLKQAYKHLQ